MSDPYRPRHNGERAERLTHHVPVWRRLADRAAAIWRRLPRWGRVILVVAVILAPVGTWALGHAEGHAHATHQAEAGEHSHPEAAPEPAEVVVEQRMPEECADALAHAEDGLKLSADHFADMTAHIEDTGQAGRHHLKDMRKVMDKLDKLRDRYEQAKLGCQLQPPKPTRGGGS